MTNLIKLDKQFLDAKSTLIDSKNIESFKTQFGDLAKVEFTSEMIAVEEQKLARDKQSTANLAKLKPLIFERQKLFTERYKMILSCITNGFKNEQERTELMIDFANAYKELKCVISKLYFGLDQSTKSANGYISAYRK